MIVDTSALLAFYDRNEPKHRDVVDVIDQATGPLVISPYVVAELDYLLLTRHGPDAEQAVLADLAAGGWELAHMDAARVTAAAQIVERYADVPIGIADASNVVLAEAYGTRSIVTLDRRHFGILRAADGSALTVLPTN